MPTDRKQGYRASTFKMIDANAITADSEETVWRGWNRPEYGLLLYP
jgi:hypothetical protein